MGVNLASRLESACKEYSAQILASEFTVRSLKGTYRSREVARVVVKGKTEPVGVYEMLDYHTDESFPNMPLVLNHFRKGVGLLQERGIRKRNRSVSGITQPASGRQTQPELPESLRASCCTPARRKLGWRVGYGFQVIPGRKPWLAIIIDPKPRPQRVNSYHPELP